MQDDLCGKGAAKSSFFLPGIENEDARMEISSLPSIPFRKRLVGLNVEFREYASDTEVR